ASRILAPIFSGRASGSARRPAARSSDRTRPAYSATLAEIGGTRTCSGAPPRRKAAGEGPHKTPMERSTLPRGARADVAAAGGVRLVARPGVLQAEPLGQDVVELHSAELPLPPEAVPDDEVGLGAVEGGLAGGLVVGQFHLVEHGADVALGPHPGLADRPGVL